MRGSILVAIAGSSLIEPEAVNDGRVNNENISKVVNGLANPGSDERSSSLGIAGHIYRISVQWSTKATGGVGSVDTQPGRPSHARKSLARTPIIPSGLCKTATNIHPL